MLHFLSNKLQFMVILAAGNFRQEKIMDQQIDSDNDIPEMKARLYEYEVEHRDLDKVIDYLEAATTPDELLIRRLKKRKLMLKDRIMHLEHSLTPDIPA